MVYDFITERFVLPQQVLPDADGDAPASAAALLRAMWGRGPEPLPNLIQLAEAHGVRVLSLPPSARAVDAFSFILNGQAFAFLSTEKTAERTRFDLAHELGHLIMHTRHPVEPDETTEEAAAAPFSRDLEAEANRFAAELLMPAAEIRAAAGPAPAVPDVLRLKTRYRVSAIAMARRFHDLELSSEWAYRQNLVELGKLGYRTDEPGGMSRERSRVFPHVFTHLRNKGISSTEVADELGVPVELLHQLTFSQLPIAVAGDAVRSAGPRPALKLIDGGA
ncbi:ImmA/IrrE family metallo-endopeptidase [Brevibacterium ammoniilyticum]|uniref:ImmA/IrrE family metallo-endopeptidase n=1 Tax=Brevibacterium ammoniilyticum TaxID=1046555 RepID=UPI0031398B7C